MQYIQNDMLRAWVLDHLKKTIFMKAHELYIQTRCEVFLLVKYDSTKKGQYYASGELLKEFDRTGVLKSCNFERIVDGRGTTVSEKQTQFGSENDDGCVEVKVSESKVTNTNPPTTPVPTAILTQPIQMQVNTKSSTVTPTPMQIQMVDEKGNLIPNSNLFQLQPVGNVIANSQVQSGSMQVLNNYVMMAKPQLPSSQISTSSADKTPSRKRVSPNSKLKAILPAGDSTQASNYPAVNAETPEDSKFEMLKNIRGDAASEASTSQTICECGICNKTFRNPDVLRKHMNRFHTEYVGEGGAKDFPGRNDQGRFPCNVCGKTYKYHHHMKEHRQTHAKIKPFICKVCDKQFHRHRELRIHQLRHTSLPKYKCAQCNKSYYTLASLKEHQHTHTGHMICCHLCGKSFGQRSSLATHLHLCHNITFKQQTEKGLLVRDEEINEDGEITPGTMLQNIDSSMSECFSQLDSVKQKNENEIMDNEVFRVLPKESNNIIIKEEPLDAEYEKVLLSCSVVAEDDDDNEDEDDAAGLLVEKIQSYVDGDEDMIGEDDEREEGDDEVSVILTAESDGEDDSGMKALEEGEISMSKVCDICGKNFNHAQQMLMHRCIHFETTMTHKCSYCDETFNEASHLRVHLTTHVGAFTRTCLICGREFTRAADVRRHLRGASCRPIRKPNFEIKEDKLDSSGDAMVTS
ncbi:zinc finger protein 90-like [Anneissia japonica]|uniref:zinc finger protein 90-like n=1 Tax=Anneissia japonica TaxID=1529436 RepID=UPI0014257B18|nr:zinc finger protein 90-like [Anneissia japonica]XP_033112267.1 zinc finger protein 90-like [Anneissia japonica]XP_033112268.1 zinc finger protein 90-like [Anneissia japonica]